MYLVFDAAAIYLLISNIIEEGFHLFFIILACFLFILNIMFALLIVQGHIEW
jgi:hypothetical protein